MAGREICPAYAIWLEVNGLRRWITFAGSGAAGSANPRSNPLPLRYSTSGPLSTHMREGKPEGSVTPGGATRARGELDNKLCSIKGGGLMKTTARSFAHAASLIPLIESDELSCWYQIGVAEHQIHQVGISVPERPPVGRNATVLLRHETHAPRDCSA
jgi:hypothetical protein